MHQAEISLASFSSWSLFVFSGSLNVALGHSLCHFEDNWAPFTASHKNRIWAAHIYMYSACAHTRCLVLIWPLRRGNPSPVAVCGLVPSTHMQKYLNTGVMMELKCSCFSFFLSLSFILSFFFFLSVLLFSPFFAKTSSSSHFLFIQFFVLIHRVLLPVSQLLTIFIHRRRSDSVSLLFLVLVFFHMSHVHPHSSVCFCMDAHTCTGSDFLTFIYTE